MPTARYACLFLCCIFCGFGHDRISLIECFGYRGIDLARVQKALAGRKLTPITLQTKAEIRDTVRKLLGKDPTDVATVCCDEHGDSTLFVGLPGASSKPFAYRPEPKGDARLSPKLVELSDKADHAIEAAVRKGGGAAQEDDSQGYALVKDPAARAAQLAVREYALLHEDELYRVLENSSDARQRQIAVDALGYVHRSKKQIDALLAACRDSDGEVRNDAIRAIGVLASLPDVARQIPAAPFVEMVNSGIWTDRNKAAFVLQQLSAARSPAVLAAIRSGAIEPLTEMARWNDISHAYGARLILGRVAGIPEKRLNELAEAGKVDAILAAVGKP